MNEKQCPSLRQLDTWIREGKSKRVRYELKRLQVNTFSREDLFSLADIARRVQLPHLVLRWLRPYVHPETPGKHTLRTNEVALYGLALSRIGVFKEAQETLKKLNPDNYPQVLFYKGLANIEQWDYESAIAPFLKYINRKDITEYQRTVGLLNLAACYVGVTNWKKAQELFQQLKSREDIISSQLLRSNILELEAQTLILQGQYQAADKILSESLSLIGKDNYQYELFIRKWKAILKLAQDPSDSTEIDKVRQESVKNNLFETTRDCDFFHSYFLKDEKHFLKLYFGSHFKHYKKRILKLYRWNKPLPITQKFHIGPETTSVFQLNTNTLPLTKKAHQLLLLLLSDIYRPFSLSETFAEIYSDEYFDPNSSKKRVTQLISNLRLQLRDLKIPIEIEIKTGLIFLKPLQKIEIILKRKKRSMQVRKQIILTQIYRIFSEKKFTSKDVSQTLNISERSARRLLESSKKTNWLKKEQGKKGYLYQFKTPK